MQAVPQAHCALNPALDEGGMLPTLTKADEEVRGALTRMIAENGQALPRGGESGLRAAWADERLLVVLSRSGSIN